MTDDINSANDADNLDRLREAVGTISERIGKMAAALNSKLDDGEKVETKELKEMTAAAKELSAVIRGLSNEGDDGDSGRESDLLRVQFDGKWGEWAK